MGAGIKCLQYDLFFTFLAQYTKMLIALKTAHLTNVIINVNYIKAIAQIPTHSEGNDPVWVITLTGSNGRYLYIKEDVYLGFVDWL